MSLNYKPLGNPAWGKGKPSANPFGRPKGPTKKALDTKRRLLAKWKTHPVDKLVRIANFIEVTNPEMAAKIWIKLLESCELEERKKKDFLPPVDKSEETTLSEKEALQILEDIENGQTQAFANGAANGVAGGTPPVQTQASPTQDLPGHQEEQ